jgi:hypothetical protein
MSEDRTRFLEIIRESNRQGRDAWERFGPHRGRVHGLVAGFAATSSSACLLGAGNLNDVRLGELLDVFAEVHLVDVDLDAVRAALGSQGLDERKNCRVHGPVDLTGILDRLPVGTADHEPELAEALVDVLGRARCNVSGGPFDVTVSTGVLTQLLQSIVDAAITGEEAARVSLALRDKHLADLAQLTRPGGILILVSDVVSTATAPHLAHVAEADLEQEMAALVAAENFFTGTNPYRIVALLEEHPRLREAVTDVQLIHPWMWAVTPERHHLTYAIVARRRSNARQ